MKKKMAYLLSLLMLIEAFYPTSFVRAATTKETLYKGYALCVDNYSITCKANTGYISKKGDVWYFPVEQLAKVLTYQVTKSNSGKTITLKKGKNSIVISANKASLTQNGKAQTLIAKAYMQNKKYLMVPVQTLESLGLHYKIYSSKSAKSKGYSSGVLVVSTKGTITGLPKKQMHSAAVTLDAARTATQIVMVDYQKASTAIVSYHEKSKSGQWKKKYEEIGYIGKKGLGKTKEWDNKTPKGTYFLGEAFGIKSNPGTSVKYTKVTKYHYAVDDHNYPKYYNTLVDVRDLGVSKVFGEHIIDYGKAYNYGIWINYNSEKKLGKGSSIFLHCKGKKKYTEGCVAISEKMMVNILKRLKVGAKIVIF